MVAYKHKGRFCNMAEIKYEVVQRVADELAILKGILEDMEL